MLPTTTVVSLLWALLVQAGLPPAGSSNSVSVATSGGDEIVTIERLTVKGSRLATPSVEYLSGLRPGMKVNEAGVRRAAQRIADSGLVKNVGYQYESLSSPRSVELEFTISDELPLLAASIQIPDVDAEDVWAYLHGIDPLYTRELPRTQKAIALYTRAIERYFASQKDRSCGDGDHGGRERQRERHRVRSGVATGHASVEGRDTSVERRRERQTLTAIAPRIRPERRTKTRLAAISWA